MKILVSDFDDTFFTDDIEENVKLVNEFINQNNIFIIATGRPLYLLKPELIKYKVNYNFLICNDGAVIFDNKDNIIDKTNIDYLTAVQIYNVLKRSYEIEHVYVDAIYDFKGLDSKDFNGILALPYNRDNVNQLLKEICYKYPTIQGYLSHRWINILSIDASKGNAIKYLENMYDWKEEYIYTIGDNNNDLSMTIYNNCYAVLSGKKEFIDKCNYKVKNFKEMIDRIK